MTQPASFDACRHGYLPGGCVKESCSHSARARALYLVPVEPDAPVNSPLRARALAIAQVVAADYNVSVNDVLSACKKTEYLEPRWVLYWVCRNVPEWNWSVISRALARDRTCIMAGARKVEQRMLTDVPFAQRLARLVGEVSK